jgi:carboxylesterase
MTKTTCVLIHGFTGGPYEIEPLAEELRKQGYEVEIPILAGHGMGRQHMAGVTYQDWIDSVDRICQKAFAYSHMGEGHQRILIGFSMGGWIAAHLANKYEANRLVMISPPYVYPNPKQVIVDGFRFILGRNPGARRYFAQYNRKIRLTPLRSVLELKRLVTYCSPCLPEIQIPTLVLQGELDHVVCPHGATLLYKRIGSPHKEIGYFPKSRHFLCLDEEKEEVIERIVRFLEQSDG